MPNATAIGHKGIIISAKYHENRVLCWVGRIHGYEGYWGYQTCLIPHLSALIGCEYMINTNAVGGTMDTMKVGDILMANDLVNLAGYCPGEPFSNIAEHRNIYPVAAEIISQPLQILARRCAQECKVKLLEGSYGMLTGPTFETRPEIKFLMEMGINTIGMSTLPEYQAAYFTNMKMVGFSMISDVSHLNRSEALTGEEVIKGLQNAVPNLTIVILKMCENIKPTNRAFDSGLLLSKAYENYNMMPPKECNLYEKAVSNLVSQLGSVNKDVAYLLLNKPNELLLKSIVNIKKQIPLTSIDSAPLYTYAANSLIIYITESNTIIIACQGLLGLNNTESYFISKVLKTAEVENAIIVIEVEDLTGKAYPGKLMAVNDYCNRSHSHPIEPKLNENPRKPFCSTISGRVLSECLGIERVNIMGFAPPFLPCNLEKEIAVKMGMSAYSITSLSILDNLFTIGVLPFIIGRVGKYNEPNRIGYEELKCIFSFKSYKTQELVSGRALCLNEIKKMKDICSHNPVIANKKYEYPAHLPADKLQILSEQIKKDYKDMPKKAIITTQLFFKMMHKHIQIEHVIGFDATYTHSQELPNIIISTIQHKKYIIADRILLGENHLDEEYSINIVRILIALGVEKIYLVTEIESTEKCMPCGKVAIIKNFLPFTNRNVLIGQNENALGPRFVDVSCILRNEGLSHAINYCTAINAVSMSESKPFSSFADEAVLKRLSDCKLLDLRCVVRKGVGLAVASHHMGKQVGMLGIVTNRIGKSDLNMPDLENGVQQALEAIMKVE